MMTLKVIVNSIGILLSIISVYIVFVNSPLNFTTVDGGNAATDWNKIELGIKRKNIWVRIGVYGIMVSSVIQLISNFLS